MSKCYPIKLIFMCITLAFVFTGCGSGPQPKTGFLSDYSKLQQSPDYDETMVYFNPALPLKNYNKFIVEPVKIFLSKKGKDRGVDPSKLREVADYFHEQMVAELEKSGYQVVSSAGPGTLRMKTAITEVVPAKIAMNIHPGTILTGVGLGGASAEAEFVDSQSGKVVAAGTDSQKGERGFGGMTKYGNAKNVAERWAKRIAIRLDKAHGKTRK